MEPCQPAEFKAGEQVAEAVAAILSCPGDPGLKRACEGAGGVRDGRVGGIAPQVSEHSDACVADRYLEAAPAAGGSRVHLGGDERTLRAGAMVDCVVDELADGGEDFGCCRAAEMGRGQAAEPGCQIVRRPAVQLRYLQ